MPCIFNGPIKDEIIKPPINLLSFLQEKVFPGTSSRLQTSGFQLFALKSLTCLLSQIWQCLPECHSPKEGLQPSKLRGHLWEDNQTGEAAVREHHEKIPRHPTVWPLSKICKQPGVPRNWPELRVDNVKLFPQPAERDPGEEPTDALWERRTKDLDNTKDNSKNDRDES